MIRLLAIDPGLTSGLCYSENGQILLSTYITTSPETPVAARLWWFLEDLKYYLTIYRPTHIAVEDVALVRPPKGKFQKNNFTTPTIYGLILMEAYKKGIPLILLSPTSIKYEFTGNGRAGKKEILATAKTYGFAITNHNQADALAIERVAYGLLTTGTFSSETPPGR